MRRLRTNRTYGQDGRINNDQLLNRYLLGHPCVSPVTCLEGWCLCGLSASLQNEVKPTALIYMKGQMLSPNSPPTILERIQSGRIGWAGTLAMTTARTGLILFVQVAVATAFLIRRDPAPWRAQAPWWTVYATLVDIGCLLLLWRQTKHEGIRFIDLFGIERARLGLEALWGLLYLVAMFPVLAGGTKLASWLVYGTTQLIPAMLAPGLLSERHLPHWAVVYSLSVFWLVWSPTEEVIYQAYCAARLQALTGSTWATVTLVGAGHRRSRQIEQHPMHPRAGKCIRIIHNKGEALRSRRLIRPVSLPRETSSLSQVYFFAGDIRPV